MNPGPFTIWQQKLKFSVGSSNGSGHSTGMFPEKMKCSDVFLFSHSRLKWPENSVPFVKIILGPVHSRTLFSCKRHGDALLVKEYFSQLLSIWIMTTELSKQSIWTILNFERPNSWRCRIVAESCSTTVLPFCFIIFREPQGTRARETA